MASSKIKKKVGSRKNSSNLGNHAGVTSKSGVSAIAGGTQKTSKLKKPATKSQSGTKSSYQESAQNNYSEKKSGKRASSTSSGSKKARPTLQPLRDELEVLVNQANERAKLLIENEKPSRALLEAQRSWANIPSRANDDVLFRSDLKTRRQIDREFARVHEFLNDYTSTWEGARKLETNLSDLSGSFGANWNMSGLGENYNTEIIDEEKAKKAFSIYRKVLEAAGGWERAVGFIKGKESLIGYGSENLINNIYDMVENEYNEDDIMTIALEQVESGIQAYEEMSKRQVADYDYGVIFDDESVEARRRFYTARRARRKGVWN